MPPKHSRSSSPLPEIIENNDDAVPAGNDPLAPYVNEMPQYARTIDGIVNSRRMVDAALEHKMPAMDAASAALYDEIQNDDAIIEALAIKASLLMKDLAAMLARAMMMPVPAAAEVLPSGEVDHNDDA